MDLLFPDDGLVYQLQKILATTVKYRLFTNNVTPTLAFTVASLTEAAWAGYAAVSQDISNYTVIGVSGHNGYALAAPVAFSNTSGAPVTPYGYFVTDNGGTKLLAVARFDAAPVTIPDGQSYNVVPVWGDFSGLTS
jgi:hypothetical protein